MSSVTEAAEYLIRRKVFTIVGAKFHIYDAEGNLIGFSKQKAFKLKEDIRIYSDESMTEELLWIQARNIIDFSAAYDVIDVPAQTKLGALRRRGFKSILRDAWELLDATDQLIGKIEEDSMGMAILRRFINLIPQSFHATVDGRVVAQYRQNFNPFVLKLRVSIAPDCPLDRKLLLAAGVLLVAIEGRQT